MEFTDVIKNRYACKKYSNRAVEDDKLAAILEAGRVAPTAKNLQEQHVYVLQSTEALEKFDGLTPCRYGAPVVLLVAFDSENVYTYPDSERTSGVEDASIVATHMILAAANEGVDSCWVNRLNPDEVAKAFDLPGKRGGSLCDRPWLRSRGRGPASQPRLAQRASRDRHAAVEGRHRGGGAQLFGRLTSHVLFLF